MSHDHDEKDAKGELALRLQARMLGRSQMSITAFELRHLLAERRELLARQANIPEPDRTAAQARLSELEREYGIAGTAQARLTDLFFGEGFRMGGLARQVPDPGSQVASDAIEKMLAEYQYPSNPKNAARAGWQAARRWLSPFPTTTDFSPATESPTAHQEPKP